MKRECQNNGERNDSKRHRYSGGGKMKHLSSRYAKIAEYKGMDICALKKATPSNGDELGYRIDDILYDGMVFADPGEAMKAIDSLARIQ